MTPSDLLFQEAPATSGDLVFGAAETKDSLLTIGGSFAPLTAAFRAAPENKVTITGTFAPLQVAAQISKVSQVVITGAFQPLQAAMEANYSSNTARPTVGQQATSYQAARPYETGASFEHQEAELAPAGWAAFWQKTVGTPALVAHPLPSVFNHERNRFTTGQQDGVKVRSGISPSHHDAERSPCVLSAGFQDGVKLRDDTLFKHEEADRTKRGNVRGLYQEAVAVSVLRSTSMQSAVEMLFGMGGRFQEGVPPPPGITLPPGVVIPPPNTCYIPGGHLVFSEAWQPFGNLVFICDNYTPPITPPTETVVVPVKRVYFVLNSVNLFRVSDNAPVPTLSMALSIDVDSWTWSFSASLPSSAQALVEPTGSALTELKALVNGTEFRVIAESVSRERTFGQSSIRVSGRGRNASLDAPYAAARNFANTSDRTAQQLMADVLTINGVPLGWVVNWGLEDWTVPAGVFNHQGTYISALNAIAGAAGGFLLPHSSGMSFSVKPRYQAGPWDWASLTPDFSIPADVATQEGIEWIDKAHYNRVYVSGESQGVLGNIKRAGTAGDVVAQMVTDPLITEGAAARQRGLAVLSDTGLQANVTLRLPVLAETGILVPGHLIDYVDGATTRRGIVRSTQVSVGSEANVWQSVGVETHV